MVFIRFLLRNMLKVEIAGVSQVLFGRMSFENGVADLGKEDVDVAVQALLLGSLACFHANILVAASRRF